tara:strand:+ start:595 stop:1194 length:600 start_codon:yes stop_codon:yes gene_type:complete
MTDEKLSKEQIIEISKALDRVVTELPWGQSVFLSAVGKKFEKIRDEFQQDISGILANQNNTQENKSDRFALKENQLEVYIGVYNAQGTDLGQWARVISNLTSQCVSRPMYFSQSAVKEMIRSKVNLNNEGYVLIHVNKSDLMDIEKERLPRDKLGNILLLLKERVITQEIIKKFYHDTGIYEYKQGIMSRFEDMTFSEN